MEFGFINILGMIIVLALSVPNIVYALHKKDRKTVDKNRVLHTFEQIGRYASIILMVIPLGFKEFGFANVAFMLIYMIGNLLCLFIYLIVWLFFFKNPTTKRALTLAIIPAIIFLISGITLSHWLLIIAGIIFGTCHIIITYQNYKTC